jgi:CheY-like chemotaxis protein
MKALKKILVVDDDPVVGKSFDRVLAPKGYAVISAASGAEALARLAHEDYEAVYTDLRMPGMDGLQLARHLKEVRPWLPVVIVTGYGSETNEAAARKIGVSAFLHKPLSPDLIEASAGYAVSASVVEPVAPATPAPEAAPQRSRLARFALNAALFFAAPFIGLAYVVALPFVGIGVLAWQGYKAVKGNKT